MGVYSSPACLPRLCTYRLVSPQLSKTGMETIAVPPCLPSSLLDLHQLFRSCSGRLTRALPLGCTCGAGGVRLGRDSLPCGEWRGASQTRRPGGGRRRVLDAARLSAGSRELGKPRSAPGGAAVWRRRGMETDECARELAGLPKCVPGGPVVGCGHGGGDDGRSVPPWGRGTPGRD